MIFLNEFSKLDKLPREAAEKFVLLLSPFAPHLGEELWQQLGHENTLAYEPWPEWDEAVLKLDEVEILVQVLGKPKARLMMPVDAAQEQAEKIALAAPEVQAALNGKPVKKVIFVPKTAEYRNLIPGGSAGAGEGGLPSPRGPAETHRDTVLTEPALTRRTATLVWMGERVWRTGRVVT